MIRISDAALFRGAAKRATFGAIRNPRVRKRVVAYGYFAASRLKHGLRRPEQPSVELLLDYGKVLHHPFRVSCEIYRGNTFYGIGETLRAYAEYPKPIRACIEHGVYFGEYVNPQETRHSGYPALITPSRTRQRHIAKTSQIATVAVGPYIAYASPYLSEMAMATARSQLGRVLLVFASHGIEGLRAQYDTDRFISWIRQLQRATSTDRVLVCLYFRDIERGQAPVYEEAGFRVVTAGRREDPQFLRRLRSLIELSVVTASNSVGTHVGYCVYLERPHTIFAQAVQYEPASLGYDSESALITAESALSEKRVVLSAFDAPTTELSTHQRLVTDTYWGLSQIRSSEELREVFSAIHQVDKGLRPELPSSVTSSPLR